jgi:hypothetical protein
LSEERVRERFNGAITSDARTVAMSVVDAKKPTDSNYTEIKARGVRSAIRAQSRCVPNTPVSPSTRGRELGVRFLRVASTQ